MWAQRRYRRSAQRHVRTAFTILFAVLLGGCDAAARHVAAGTPGSSVTTPIHAATSNPSSQASPRPCSSGADLRIRWTGTGAATGGALYARFDIRTMRGHCSLRGTPIVRLQGPSGARLAVHYIAASNAPPSPVPVGPTFDSTGAHFSFSVSAADSTATGQCAQPVQAATGAQIRLPGESHVIDVRFDRLRVCRAVYVFDVAYGPAP